MYAKYDLKQEIYQRIMNCGGEPRYKVIANWKTIYEDCMVKYGKNIKIYLDKFR